MAAICWPRLSAQRSQPGTRFAGGFACGCRCGGGAHAGSSCTRARLALAMPHDGAPRRPCCSVPPAAALGLRQGPTVIRLLDDRSAVSRSLAERPGPSRAWPISMPVTVARKGQSRQLSVLVAETMADLEAGPPAAGGGRQPHQPTSARVGAAGSRPKAGQRGAGGPAAYAEPWPRRWPWASAGLPMAAVCPGPRQRAAGLPGPGGTGLAACWKGSFPPWVFKLALHPQGLANALAAAAATGLELPIRRTGGAIEDALIEAATGMRTCRPCRWFKG